MKVMLQGDLDRRQVYGALLVIFDRNYCTLLYTGVGRMPGESALRQNHVVHRNDGGTEAYDAGEPSAFRFDCFEP